MRPRTNWQSLPLLAPALFVAKVSAAQPEPGAYTPGFDELLPGATLHVQVDPSAADCPSARELANAVWAQLHVHADRTPKAVLTVSLARQGSDYLGHVHVQGSQTGERTLRVPGADCAGLKDALVVTLVLILDASAQPQTASLPVAPFPFQPPAPKAEPVPPREGGLGVGFGAAITEGLPRGLSSAFVAELEYSSGNWRTALGAFLSPKQKVHFQPGVVDLWLYGGQSRLCRLFWRDDAETPVVSLCVEGLLGKLTGEGHDFASNRTQERPWVALGPSVSVASRLELPVSWEVRAITSFPLRRDAFSVEGVPGTAYRVPVLSLGLEGLLRVRIL